MQAANRLRTAFTKGAGPSLGLWQMIPGANVSRVLAKSPGIDWVLVDCEHGNIDGNILVPLLRTPQEAKDLVQSAKFPPWGRRGFGSPLAMERFNPAPTMTEYLQQANDSLLTMVQIETQEALNSVEDIAAVEGIDVLFIGPFDLGQSERHGYQSRDESNRVAGNNIGHPVINGVIKKELSDAIDRILEATHKAGKKAGIFCTSGEQSKFFGDKGFDMISVATDYTALQYTLAESLSIARGAAKPAKGGSY
ncbi:4-hydroxy-2-oxo-heptane-1,7-dioate aldolase [Colletotrichum sp. SAR 10_70]|nr:4-hydroxy-2-oxo-heptane-1,7-dioate aldolase [Colletotrichum sp. SAR 10_70]KAI8251202.1 4-hydroxy-2-oxo-heptane-1,7-dioate aldolase [Colletotrichum sp. SAR11_239]